MSNQRTRPPAFAATEANLGGAHMILSDYVNLHSRAAGAGPTRGILATKHQQPYTKAQRMSHNRAVRLAVTDTTSIEHVHRLFHLNRRIEDMYSAAERKKNPFDATMFPAYQRRVPMHGTRPGLHEALVEPWAEGYGYRTVMVSGRPVTAPAATKGLKPVKDQYQGWSVTTNLRHTFPADDFPLTRRFRDSSLASEYSLYRKAMMGEIVEHRMYRETDLKTLFKTYLKMAPLHDKQVVEQVIRDLREELDVSP